MASLVGFFGAHVANQSTSNIELGSSSMIQGAFHSSTINASTNGFGFGSTPNSVNTSSVSNLIHTVMQQEIIQEISAVENGPRRTDAPTASKKQIHITTTTLESITTFIQRTSEHLIRGACRGWLCDGEEDKEYEGNIDAVNEVGSIFHDPTSRWRSTTYHVNHEDDSSAASTTNASNSGRIYGIRGRWSINTDPKIAVLGHPNGGRQPCGRVFGFSGKVIEELLAHYELKYGTIRKELSSQVEKENLRFLISRIFQSLCESLRKFRDPDTGLIGSTELWYALKSTNLRNLWAYLGCTIEGQEMIKLSTPVIRSRQINPKRPETETFIITHEMPPYAKILKSNFSVVLSSMGLMNRDCWYQDLNRVAEVAREFIHGERSSSKMDRICYEYHIHPLQYYCRVNCDYITFQLSDGSLNSPYQPTLVFDRKSEQIILIGLFGSEVIGPFDLDQIDIKLKELNPLIEGTEFKPYLTDERQAIFGVMESRLSDSESRRIHAIQQLENILAEYDVNSAVEQIIPMTYFSKYGPSLFSENHPKASIRTFNHTLIDTVMSDSGLKFLPEVILDLIGQYFSFSLPFLEDEANKQMSKYDPIVQSSPNVLTTSSAESVASLQQASPFGASGSVLPQVGSAPTTFRVKSPIPFDTVPLTSFGSSSTSNGFGFGSPPAVSTASVSNPMGFGFGSPIVASAPKTSFGFASSSQSNSSTSTLPQFGAPCTQSNDPFTFSVTSPQIVHQPSLMIQGNETSLTSSKSHTSNPVELTRNRVHPDALFKIWLETEGNVCPISSISQEYSSNDGSSGAGSSLASALDGESDGCCIM